MDRSVSRAKAKVPPEWRGAQTLHDFAETLDFRSFAALSHGLGLGDVKEPAAKPGARDRSGGASVASMPVAAYAPNPRGLDARTEAQAEAHPASSQPALQPVAPTATPPRRERGKAPLELRLMSLAIDFLFVTSSIAMAVAAATVLAASRQPGTPWLELRPLAWMSGFHPFEILAGVYGVYLIYLLTFRFVVGRTLGQSLLRPRQNPGRAAASH